MTGPVEIGQVGLGAWGKNLLRNFHAINQSRVRLACDANDETCAKVSNMFQGVNLTTKYDDILNDDKIEAVVIATPPAMHYKLAMQAIEAGKDVFVEKPLVLDLSEGKKLVEAAEKNEKILMVGHIMVYHPVSLFLKKYIEKDELGEIYYLYASRINLGKVRDIENSLWSFAPHDISLIMFLLEKFPQRVTATGADYLQKDIEDVSFMTMHFADKTMAHVHVSWLDPHKERKLTIVGSKKMVVFDDSRATEKVWLYDKGVDTKLDYSTYGEYLNLRVGDITLPHVPGGEPLRSECTHFLECVRTRVTPRSDGRDGLRVLSVLQAAQDSLKQGGTPVDVNPID
ncbi:MAG: Gfo/Idh/MocA family oxidoreductase [candidate division Zixibacteria bacterium]|nr:Gfo/Idh/MocA family oxidoreductase [candidate division Zixibacteria bacterium]